MTEKLLKDFDLAARDIYDQLVNKLSNTVFLIYGHSMGAYLALRVTAMLEEAGKQPAYLIVSGNAGPGLGSSKKRHLLERESFVNELKQLGGFPLELIEDKEFFNLYEPILRADFEIAEGHDLLNEPVVGTPVHAIMGTEEEKKDQISNWGRFTRSDFSFEILKGDHFFIHKQEQRMADIITDCYRKAFLFQNR